MTGLEKDRQNTGNQTDELTSYTGGPTGTNQYASITH